MISCCDLEYFQGLFVIDSIMRSNTVGALRISHRRDSINFRRLHVRSPCLLSSKTLLRTCKRGQSCAAKPFRSLIARPASTSSVLSETRSFGTRTTNLVLGTVIGLSLVFGYYYLTDTRAGIHQWVAVPSLRWIYDDAEDAHVAGIKALKGLYKFGIHPRERGDPDQAGDLEIKVSKVPHFVKSDSRKGLILAISDTWPHPEKSNRDVCRY